MEQSRGRHHHSVSPGSLNVDESVFKRYIESQRDYFFTGATLSLSSRIIYLQRFKKVIQCCEKEIADALYADFRKSYFEAVVTETEFVINEIDHILKHLKKWGRPSKLRTPFMFFPGKSFTVYQPYGVVLVISPWNYPFQLSLMPVIGAIAAGNCIILKPSELAPAVSSVIATRIGECFDDSLLKVVEGGVETTKKLLKQKFDYIFYTGSRAIGQKVMEQASKHLTPVTLELGGKNPCIVTRHIDLKVAARRIVWGKFMNCGQTCVAPDYLLVEKSIKKAFISQLIETIHQFYGEHPEIPSDYARIINAHHFDRLLEIIEKSSIIYGGQAKRDSLYIQPTLTEGCPNAFAMQEEIFGPLLPVITVDTLSQAVGIVKESLSPLVVYLFSTRNNDMQMLHETTRSGALVVNDAVTYLAHPGMPFGGFGESGMGKYHGRHSFTTFSHAKPVMKCSFKFDLSCRYPPYEGKLKKLQKITGILSIFDRIFGKR